MFSILEWKKSEVLFVVVVVAVVVGISGIQLKIGQMKTRDVQRKADVELVGRALTAYLEDHQALPLAVDGRIANCGWGRSQPCVWGQDAIGDDEGVIYLKKLPIDPFTYKGWRYVYTVNPERTKYRICINLESKKDVQCSWYVEN